MKNNVIILTLLFSTFLFSCETKQEKLEGLWLITKAAGNDVSKEDVKLNLGKDGVAVNAKKGIVGTWLLTSDQTTIELRESRQKRAEEFKIVSITENELIVLSKKDTLEFKKVKE
jgi:hypothetical protein